MVPPMPGRPPATGRDPRSGGMPRVGFLFSALLHLGLAALVVLASWQREKPQEPTSPAAYEFRFEGGAPEQPSEQSNDSAPEDTDLAEPEPPLPETASAEPEEVRPPTEPEQAATAEAEPLHEPVPEPPSPETAAVAPSEAPAPPREEQAANEAETAPESIPPPPPPAPPQAQQQAALTAPPRPARPPPLPGLFLPEARTLQPIPPRAPGSRQGLDLSLGTLSEPGRHSAEPEVSVRGANVGPNWYSALRRWWIDNRRYPANAAVVGHEGTATVEMLLAQDGRVQSVRLMRPSGSVWLDAGAVAQFRNAMLPALPPGADPNGTTLTFTIRYRIVQQ